MKLLLTFVLISLSCVYCQEEKYTDKYDSMNIDEVLANKRLITAYLKCLDGSGRCTAEGRYLKNHIVDALETGCKKCTKTQLSGARKVMKYMMMEEPALWEKLVKMYDTKGMYAKKYTAEIMELKKEMS